MKVTLVDIQEYKKTGFQPLIDFNSWRVAILRWAPSLEPDEQESMERHTQTDEVFVLLDGKATLIVGGNDREVDDIQSLAMEGGKLYNVKQDTWHTVLLSRDASLLIVENCDTGEANSEFWMLTPEQRQEILELAVSFYGC